MPKLKTRRSIAKRFRFTGSGKIKRGRAGLRHLLTSKPSHRKRKLRRPALVAKVDRERIERALPYGARY
jgi:large subunit ribosomal protein L35